MRSADLPHDMSAEQSVLAGCMRWGAEAVADVLAIIGESPFFIDPHQALWDAVRSASDRGGKLDRVSLEAELRNRGTAERCNSQIIATVAGQTPRNASELLAHANLVASHSQARLMITRAQELVTALREGRLTGEVLSGELHRGAEEITEIAHGGGMIGLPQTVADVGHDWQAQFDLELSGTVQALQTGFPDLDRKMKGRGLRPGWMVLLSGRPKMGKTALALQVAMHAMFERCLGWPVRWRLRSDAVPVLIACDEMRNRELYERLLANLAGIDASIIGSPTREWYDRNSESLAAARRLLESAPLSFCPDEVSNNLPKICAYARRWRNAHEILERDSAGKPVRGPALMMLDFLQSFSDLPGTERLNINERVGRKAKLVKDTSKDLQVSTILVSQLNRKCEERDDKRPLASDNEGSGQIEQYGDVMIGCYRAIVYDEAFRDVQAQYHNLRERAVSGARESKSSIRDMLTDLEEMISLHNATEQTAVDRLNLLQRRGPLSREEVKDISMAARRLTSAEIIVQRNRHGPDGTVYANFHGQYFRFTPRTTSHAA